MAKMIFSQNSPAVRFISQRFRKWEIKKNLMAAEFGVDLFFEPGSTWTAVWRGSLESFQIIMSIHSSLSLSHCERLTNDPMQPSLALRPAWKYERGRSFLFLQYKTQCGLAALDIFKWYMGNHPGQMLLLIDSNLIDGGLRLYLNVFDHRMVLFQRTYREIHPILDCVD